MIHDIAIAPVEMPDAGHFDPSPLIPGGEHPAIRALKLDRKTVRHYLNAAAKSPTISTPGSTGADSKSPRISTPGVSSGSQWVAEALEAEAGRPSLCLPHRQRIELKLAGGSDRWHIQAT